MTVGLIYVGLLIVGVVYAVISAALGWLGDIGGGDADVSGQLDAGHAHPISGTIVATFVTGFGGGGTVAHYLGEWSLLGSLLAATLSGLGLAAAAFAVLELIFTQTQAGSEFLVGDVAGHEAEVITSIPAGGTGEVAYEAKGQREIAAARSVDGTAVAKGRLVVVEKVMGNTLHVREKR